ncbi:unnamed protein product [Chondrus crispus]|uniref:Uncharacterized protein n=1 Tax=Chondrus crispus TaxID=2769 RepID=R7Q6D3_CHOCR|nr:unnamed protein product [Chondrus crispus]CDF34097.1 unnamed protein product [Chondrus crispus]|eukprot:XP_005713916.1 unnamed protein product [Chondrus crispus]
MLCTCSKTIHTSVTPAMTGVGITDYGRVEVTTSDAAKGKRRAMKARMQIDA